jgi:triacylglycerol lipase
MFRALKALCLGVLAAVAIAVSGPMHTAHADGPPVVVMAHGADFGTGLGLTEFDDNLKPWLQAEGYEVRVVRLGNNLYTNADYIRQAVAEIPADREVHVVGAQYGGLAARYYLKYLGGATRVASYTSYDTSQYGRTDTCWYFGQNCYWHPFMSLLNTGDDTPGTVRYLQIKGEVVPTVLQTPLDGGATIVSYPQYDHVQIVRSAEAFQDTLHNIRGY